MARLYQSGAELNSTTTGEEFTSVTSATVSSANPRSGTYHLRLSPSASIQSVLIDFLSSGAQTVFIRFAYYINTQPANGDNILRIQDDTTNATQVSIQGTGSGIKVLDQAGNQIGSNVALSTGQYYCIELKAFCNTGSSTIELKLNNVSQLVSTTATMTVSGNSLSRALFGVSANSTYSVDIDDIAINDSTGTAQNSWPGDGKIIHLRPNAAGDNNQWYDTSLGAGTSNNYTLVDEINPNDGTDFVQSRVTNEIDDYNVDNSGIGASDTVNVVAVGQRAYRSAGTTSSAAVLRIKAASAGSVTEGTANTASSSAARTNDLNTNNASPYQLVTYVRPGTASAWTQATLDTMQIGIRTSTGSGDRYYLLSTIWASVDYTPAGTGHTSTPSDTATASDSVGKAIGKALSDTATSSDSPSRVSGKPIMAALADNFDDNSMDANKWTETESGITITETGGRMQFDVPNSGSTSGFLESTYSYNLTNSYAHLEIVAIGAMAATTYNNDFTVYGTASNAYYSFQIINGTITAYDYDGNNLWSATWSSTTHRWLRFSHSGSTVSYDTSPDGRTWTSRATESTSGIDITSVKAYIQILMGSAIGIRQSIFDNFNITPHPLTDSVTTSDTATKAMGSVRSDTATATDAISKRLVKSIADSATSSDTRISGIGKRPADTVTVTDNRLPTVTRSLSDTATASDVISKKPGKVLSDTATASDQFSSSSTVNNYTKSLSDTVTSSDTRVIRVIQIIADAATPTDALSKRIVRTLSDTATASDSFGPVRGRLLIINDSVTVSDNRSILKNGADPYVSRYDRNRPRIKAGAVGSLARMGATPPVSRSVPRVFTRYRRT